MVKVLDFLEQSKAEAVNQIADFIPWLAPAPSAYFVAEASLALLEVPPLVAVTIAVTIEGLGITLIHTGMEFYRWNLKRMRKEFKAPVGLTLSFVVVYLVATVGLTVVLKIVPDLSLYAPALFPLLALTGAAQLVLRAQHVQRMADKEEAYSKPKDETEKQKGGKVKKEEALPNGLALQVFNRDDWTCYFCGEDVKGNSPQAIRFVPEGGNIASNLVTSCQLCQQKEKHLSPSESDIWEFSQYLRAKSAGSDKRAQILELLRSDNGNAPLKQVDIARILRTSQGYVSTIAKGVKISVPEGDL